MDEATETVRTAAEAASVAADCIASNICGDKVTVEEEFTVVTMLVTAKLDDDDELEVASSNNGK